MHTECVRFILFCKEIFTSIYVIDFQRIFLIKLLKILVETETEIKNYMNPLYHYENFSHAPLLCASDRKTFRKHSRKNGNLKEFFNIIFCMHPFLLLLCEGHFANSLRNSQGDLQTTHIRIPNLETENANIFKAFRIRVFLSPYEIYVQN